MANSNHANYGKIGLVLVAGLLAIVGTVIYVGGFGGDSSDVFLVETYFDYPVNGLSKGSDVLFQGMKVGTVKSMRLAKYTTRVVMSINRKVFDDPDEVFQQPSLRAIVSSNLLTGLSKVELKPMPEAEAPRELEWEATYPLIHPSKPMVDEFTDGIKKILVQVERESEGIDGIIKNMNEFTRQLNELITELKDNPSLLIRSSNPLPLPETSL